MKKLLSFLILGLVLLCSCYLCVVKYDFKRLICDEEKHDIY